MSVQQSNIVKSLDTFPSISWWADTLHVEEVCFDPADQFKKMSYRNRYRVSGSNNPVLLTVPLVGGRDQKAAMATLQIFNGNRWQVQHWRTLVSVYRRSPFFEHYEPSLKSLFDQEYSLLKDFNRNTILWVKKQLKLKWTLAEAPASTIEKVQLTERKQKVLVPRYYQVFEDRIGFQSDLSILDLLFSEGPAAVKLLEHVKFAE